MISFPFHAYVEICILLLENQRISSTQMWSSLFFSPSSSLKMRSSEYFSFSFFLSPLWILVNLPCSCPTRKPQFLLRCFNFFYHSFGFNDVSLLSPYCCFLFIIFHLNVSLLVHLFPGRYFLEYFVDISSVSNIIWFLTYAYAIFSLSLS